MKSFFITLAFLVVLCLAGDTTYYLRKDSHLENGVLYVHYIQAVLQDTLTAAVVPGSVLPFRVEVQDDVVINNPGILFFKDSTHAAEEPTNEND